MSFYPYLSLLLSGVGLFVSLWIVVPAPTFFFLVLGVGAPEVSPWLIGINGIALGLGASQFDRSWLCNVALVGSLLGLVLSFLPLVQLPATNERFAAEMETILGTDYLKEIPQALQTQLRRQPFVLADVFRGIKLKEVRIQKNIIFASPDGIKLKLNIYRPLAIGKYPTLIVIYGGAWRHGTPNNNETFSRYIAAQGYTVIAIDYRHAPKYKFPAQLEDVKLALQYIQERAEDLEVDTERVALMGRSAGGHLALLTAYQQDILPLRGVIAYYAPVNLTEGYQDPPVPNPMNIRQILRNFLGGTPEEFSQLYKQASPINYVTPNLPPSLLVYGSNDGVVRPKFGRQLDQKLQAKENQAVLLDIPWAEHAFDSVFFGLSNQLALYYTERFLAWSLTL